MCNSLGSPINMSYFQDSIVTKKKKVIPVKHLHLSHQLEQEYPTIKQRV